MSGFAPQGASGGGTTLTDSASLAATITDETGTGALVLQTAPTLVTPVLTKPKINGGPVAIALQQNFGGF